MKRPASSTTPVRISAAVMISKPRIINTASLPNPAKASLVVSSPVRISTTTIPSAITSEGKRSLANRINEMTMMAITRTICGSMKLP